MYIAITKTGIIEDTDNRVYSSAFNAIERGLFLINATLAADDDLYSLDNFDCTVSNLGGINEILLYRDQDEIWITVREVTVHD